MEIQTMTQPIPHPDELSGPYWEGLKRGVLMIQSCGDCGTLRHYPRLLCGECYSLAVTWVEVSGRGTIHSWTIAHHAFLPSLKEDLPYVLVVVDLEAGVRALGRLTGVLDTDIQIGLPVQFTAQVRADGLALPAFVPR